MLIVSVVKDVDTEALFPNKDFKYPDIDTRTDLECKLYVDSSMKLHDVSCHIQNRTRC